jgi:hypothetical protein
MSLWAGSPPACGRALDRPSLWTPMSGVRQRGAAGAWPRGFLGGRWPLRLPLLPPACALKAGFDTANVPRSRCATPTSDSSASERARFLLRRSLHMVGVPHHHGLMVPNANGGFLAATTVVEDSYLVSDSTFHRLVLPNPTPWITRFNHSIGFRPSQLGSYAFVTDTAW